MRVSTSHNGAAHVAFERMKTLGPCDISDLSWLNPTPHAIAVYASRPLSPVAAQHSLPSGRYSLLGPDFHRLDRTSLRLAHSFDHLIGEREQRYACPPPPAHSQVRRRLLFVYSDASVPDQLRPSRDFGFNPRCKFRRCVGDDLHAKILQMLARFILCKDTRRLAVKLVDDRLRSSGWRHQTKPHRRVETGESRFRECRDVG